MLIYVHGTIGSDHENDVAQSVKDGWVDSGGLLSNLTVTQKSGLLSVTMSDAQTNGAIFVVRSYTGITSQLNLAKEYNGIVGLCMPAGSNDHVKVFNYPIPQSIIVTAAGDDGINETGYNTEFVSNDPRTPEVASPDELDLSSFSNGYIAGQLAFIIDNLGCSVWEARNRSHKTGSTSGVWHAENGYGSIDVSAALSYSGVIDEDPWQITPTPPSQTSRRITSNSVEINIEPSDMSSEFDIYRKKISDPSYIMIGSSDISSPYIDLLPSHGVYEYVVKSKIYQMESDFSTPTTATYVSCGFILVDTTE